MRLHLPQPDETYSFRWATRLVDLLQIAFIRTLTTENSSPYLLLESPSGLTFKVTVSDQGIMKTTFVPKGSAGIGALPTNPIQWDEGTPS